MPVALAVCGSFPAYYGSFRNILFDFSANSCCDGEMVQFVAPYLAGTATLIDYPVRRFPRSVASVGRVKSASRHQGGGAPARGEQGGRRSNVRRRAGTRTRHLHQLGCLLGRQGARRLGHRGASPGQDPVTGSFEIIALKRSFPRWGKLTARLTESSLICKERTNAISTISPPYDFFVSS